MWFSFFFGPFFFGSRTGCESKYITKAACSEGIPKSPSVSRTKTSSITPSSYRPMSFSQRKKPPEIARLKKGLSAMEGALVGWGFWLGFEALEIQEACDKNRFWVSPQAKQMKFITTAEKFVFARWCLDQMGWFCAPKPHHADQISVQ